MHVLSIVQLCSILLAQQEDDSHVSRRAQVVLTVAYGAMIAAGLVCNAAVIMVVVRRSQIQTPRNLFIVNLTVSDITLCLVCMPFTLVMLIFKRWTLGETLCKLVPALQVRHFALINNCKVAMVTESHFSTYVYEKLTCSCCNELAVCQCRQCCNSLDNH